MADERCTAEVLKRDTYRLSGRGKGRLAMHYNAERCTRKACDDGRCWQHPRDARFPDYKWL